MSSGVSEKIKFQSKQMTILEFEPAIRTVAHSQGGWYRLSFPYTIFFVGYYRNGNNYNFNGLAFCLSRKPITSLSDQIFTVDFPNTARGEVCMRFGCHSNLDELVEKAVANFWQSKFTYDLYHHCYIVGRNILERWAQGTQQNPEYCPPATDFRTISNFVANSRFGLSLYAPIINKLGKL